jgi:hypothetical protein
LINRKITPYNLMASGKTTLYDWMGNNGQVHDILIIGVNI